MTRLALDRRPDAPSRAVLADLRYAPELCRLVLDHIPIRAFRMKLDTRAVDATVPMLRGVWGKAIHELRPEWYRAVFDVGSAPGSVAVSPPYIVRVAAPDPEWIPAIEWILIGSATEHAEGLLQCWRHAGRCGIGSRREPFELNRVEGILPDDSTLPDAAAWPLSRASWPLPPDAPCKLVFPAPLRLRYRGRLVERPTLADIIASVNRRIAGFLPEPDRPFWNAFGRQMLDAAKTVPQEPWAGGRLDLVRYSGRQKRELDIHGVTGELTLPAGARELAPILSAAQWIHVGKNTVMGLGQLLVEPLD